MGYTYVRIKDETWKSLNELRNRNETFEEVIIKLLEKESLKGEQDGNRFI